MSRTQCPPVGIICAVCVLLLAVAPAFGEPLQLIEADYPAITPPLSTMGVNQFNLSGGTTRPPFGDLVTNPQTFFLNMLTETNLQVTIGAAAAPDFPEPVFVLGGLFGFDDVRLFDIMNPGTVITMDTTPGMERIEIMTPVGLREGMDTMFLGQDLSDLRDALMIHTFTGMTLMPMDDVPAPSGGGRPLFAFYNSQDPQFSASVRIVPRGSLVPEPSTWALMASGLTGLAAGAWLRRVRAA